MSDDKNKQKKYKRTIPTVLEKEIERNVSVKKEWGSYNASIAKINR